MPNYIAHTYFGHRVLERLPRELRKAYTRDLPVFHLGLYGPDPLIFSFRTKPISDHFHRNWRQENFSQLERNIHFGNATQRSFAVGYLLHQLLDETVHPVIYQHMEETASSHFRLEIWLDHLLLEETGCSSGPGISTGGRERAALAASDFLHPATEGQYASGLFRMAALMKVFQCLEGGNARRTTQTERRQAKDLRDLLEETVAPAADALLEVMASARVG